MAKTGTPVISIENLLSYLLFIRSKDASMAERIGDLTIGIQAGGNRFND